MPNSRRRRFSVQNVIRGAESTKTQNSTQVGSPSTGSDKQNLQNTNSTKHKQKKAFPTTSKHSSGFDMNDLKQSNTSTSILITKDSIATTLDKDITASSSNIDLFNILSLAEDTMSKNYRESSNKNATDTKPKDKTTARQDKYPRHQHRIKVRSPKQKPPNVEKHETTKKSVGTETTDEHEEEVYSIQLIEQVESDVIEPIVENSEENASSHSVDDMCRICHGGESLYQELGQLISACSCRGTVGRVHVKCLERWLTESGKNRCELCGTKYATRRVHRYGVLKALVMWILSQNAKQLLVDSLGIMLMSPLAVLAAWLSGRTLAGLMTQDAHVTPWPLASTFVLACMTLVCYYCWIVSAATRHALGWWIWYRSQYEVRLQLGDNEE